MEHGGKKKNSNGFYHHTNKCTIFHQPAYNGRLCRSCELIGQHQQKQCGSLSGGGANPREDAPSMITDRRESNYEMDEENNRGYKYAEEMQQIEKTEINLLDWIDVDLENTGQAEIDDNWRKPRAVEIQGGNEEQKFDDKDGDSVITNKSGYQEAEGNLGESSVLDEKQL
jgi:hypothetical protein